MRFSEMCVHKVKEFALQNRDKKVCCAKYKDALCVYQPSKVHAIRRVNKLYDTCTDILSHTKDSKIFIVSTKGFTDELVEDIISLK